MSSRLGVVLSWSSRIPLPSLSAPERGLSWTIWHLAPLLLEGEIS